MQSKPKYVALLLAEFENRKKGDPQYSLRRFATDLGIHAPSLSGILRGIRPFPVRRAFQAAKILNVTPEIFHEVFQKQKVKPKSTQAENSYVLDLEKDAKFIEYWEYFAVLNYFNLPNENHSIEQISLKLGISIKQAETLVQELLSRGFLKLEGGKIVRAVENLATAEDIPSASLLRAHLHEMELIKKRIHEIQPVLRDLSSIVFTGNSSKIKQAKKLIRSFRKNLCKIMGRETADQVYLLSIQLLPLTRNK